MQKKTDFEVCDGIQRSEFVKMHLSDQQSVFNKMSPEQKVALWKFKFEVLQDDADLTLADKKAVDTLNLYMCPEIYTDTAEFYLTRINSYVEEVSSRLSWDDEKKYYITSTWMTKDELARHKETYGKSDGKK